METKFLCVQAMKFRTLGLHEYISIDWLELLKHVHRNFPFRISGTQYEEWLYLRRTQRQKVWFQRQKKQEEKARLMNTTLGTKMYHFITGNKTLQEHLRIEAFRTICQSHGGFRQKYNEHCIKSIICKYLAEQTAKQIRE